MTLLARLDRRRRGDRARHLHRLLGDLHRPRPRAGRAADRLRALRGVRRDRGAQPRGRRGRRPGRDPHRPGARDAPRRCPSASPSTSPSSTPTRTATRPTTRQVLAAHPARRPDPGRQRARRPAACSMPDERRRRRSIARSARINDLIAADERVDTAMVGDRRRADARPQAMSRTARGDRVERSQQRGRSRDWIAMLGGSAPGARILRARRGHRGDRPRRRRSARSATRSPTATPARSPTRSTARRRRTTRRDRRLDRLGARVRPRGVDGARARPATARRRAGGDGRSSSSGFEPPDLGDLDWDAGADPADARARSTTAPTASPPATGWRGR